MDDVQVEKKEIPFEKLYLSELDIRSNGIRLTTLDLFLRSMLLKKTKYNSFYGVPQTYYNKEFSNLQCSCQVRSFFDIVNICKTYFDATDKDVAGYLKQIISETRFNAYHNMRYGFLFCGKAGGWVLHSSDNCWSIDKNFVINYSSSENRLQEKGDRHYSMNNILELMNK
jgi:hypothetical protein